MNNLPGFEFPKAKRAPRLRQSIHDSGPRPVFVYDFCGRSGFSRKACERWMIGSFDNQELRFDLSAFASQARRPLTSNEADWLMFSGYVYAADRFSCRKPSAGATLWRRSLVLTVPVVDINLWNRAKPSIIAALSFLTDDDWSLDFVERSHPFFEEDQTHLPIAPQKTADWVCLFSGGLDSFAGAKDLLAANRGRGLMVSGWTHERLHSGQADLVNMMRERGYEFQWLPVGYGFTRINDHSSMESSQRSRGWVHVGLGLAAAAIVGCEALHLCENGVGAFNLPTELSQTGSHTSRSVHPVFLARIARAANLIFGGHFEVKQPAIFETKAELVARTLAADDAGLIASTFSCEIFPNYHSKKPQCGVCPSCLVRRASLHTAAIPDDGNKYSWDVVKRGLNPRKALGLIKMEAYVKRLHRCLHSQSRPESILWEYPEAASFFAESAGALDVDRGEFLAKVSGLHHRFAQEWDNFAATIPGLRDRKIPASES